MCVFKCEDCGAEFEEPKTYEDYRGEYQGVPSYETMTGCPICGGGYNEMRDYWICNHGVSHDYGESCDCEEEKKPPCKVADSNSLNKITNIIITKMEEDVKCMN